MLLVPSFLLAESLHVQLSTQSPLQPLYLSQLRPGPGESDWRYLDELRAVLEFDLNTGGFLFCVPLHTEWEPPWTSEDPRRTFQAVTWETRKIPFVCILQLIDGVLHTTLFRTASKSSKRYEDLLLSGRLEEDRRLLHRLSDQIHHDLFDCEGIASLRILYTERKEHHSPSAPRWSSNVWISDLDGHHSHQLTQEAGYCLSPGFLPEPHHFYYVTHRGGQSKICKTALGRPEGDILFTLRGNQMLPAISRDGTQMAFITDAAGRPDLFVQPFERNGRIAGKARQLFSAPRATQASPTYSPDGKQLAFVSDKDGSPRIYVLDIPPAHSTKPIRPQLLTRKHRENTSPAWSPDGTKIAYSAKVEGIRQIWIYDCKEETETALTTGPENKENPAWAPDSLHLIYNTESHESSELFLINLRDPHPVQISRGPGQKRFAAWEPRTASPQQARQKIRS